MKLIKQVRSSPVGDLEHELRRRKIPFEKFDNSSKTKLLYYMASDGRKIVVIIDDILECLTEEEEEVEYACVSYYEV